MEIKRFGQHVKDVILDVSDKRVTERRDELVRTLMTSKGKGVSLQKVGMDSDEIKHVFLSHKRAEVTNRFLHRIFRTKLLDERTKYYSLAVMISQLEPDNLESFEQIFPQAKINKTNFISTIPTHGKNLCHETEYCFYDGAKSENLATLYDQRVVVKWQGVFAALCLDPVLSPNKKNCLIPNNLYLPDPESKKKLLDQIDQGKNFLEVDYAEWTLVRATYNPRLVEDLKKQIEILPPFSPNQRIYTPNYHIFSD